MYTLTLLTGIHQTPGRTFQASGRTFQTPGRMFRHPAGHFKHPDERLKHPAGCLKYKRKHTCLNQPRYSYFQSFHELGHLSIIIFY